MTRATGGAVRKYTWIVVGSLLAGVLLAGWMGSAGAQTPGAGVTPVPGAWTPRVIATAHPVTDTLPPSVAPAQPVKAPAPAVLPIARASETASDLGQPTGSGAGTQRVAAVGAAPGACLTVEKVAPPSVAAGKPFAYDLVVRNVGTAEAQRVRVEEQVPADATVTGADPRPEVRGSTLTWDLGSIAAGGEARLRVGLQPGGDSDVITTAVVTCATTCTLRTHLTRPALALAATGPLSARAGDGVTFNLQLTNNTTAPLRRVLLQARLSAGLRHPEGPQVEALLPVLAPGESRSVPLNVVAAKLGRQALTATVSTPGADPMSAEAVLDVIEGAVPAPVPAGVTGSPEARPSPAPPAPLTPAAPPSLPLMPEPVPERKPADAPHPGTAPGPALPPIDSVRPEGRITLPQEGEKPIAAAAALPSDAAPAGDRGLIQSRVTRLWRHVSNVPGVLRHVRNVSPQAC